MLQGSHGHENLEPFFSEIFNQTEAATATIFGELGKAISLSGRVASYPIFTC